MEKLALSDAARDYYLTHPVEFVTDQLLADKRDENGQPVVVDDPQIKILNSAVKGEWPVVPAGRGVGKTCAISWLVIWWIYCHSTAKVIVNSVKKEQLGDNLWPEMKRWIVGSAIAADLCWEKTKVYVRGREEQNFAVARTGANIESLQGYHDPFLLVIIEEASSIDDESFDALIGSLTGPNNAIGMFGNPRRLTGPFANLIKAPSGRFRVIHIPCVDLKGNPHPRVTPEFIQRMKDRYGEDSNQYRVHVLGVLPESDDDAIVPWDWVQEATQYDALPTPDPQYRIVWGLDVATLGADSSALVKRQGPLVLDKPARRRGLHTMQTVDWIEDEYAKTPRKQRPSRIYVDRIGVGAGVADRLAQLGLPVDGVAVSRVPGDKRRFVRLRDELWWRMRVWFETRGVYIPDDGDLIKELTTPRYSIAKGKVEVESKAMMRERVPEIGSPDSADALMLTFMDQDDLLPRDQTEDEWERKATRDRVTGTTWMSA